MQLRQPYTIAEMNLFSGNGHILPIITITNDTLLDDKNALQCMPLHKSICMLHIVMKIDNAKLPTIVKALST